ncbi:MAG: DoxX family membrane protein [Desulfatitalea sp.]|nr:DoxX family membrane protein [Desulfatitalea sp.]NNK00418.1 DoxX family membrane protein [Desulfatitalea sp.]
MPVTAATNTSQTCLPATWGGKLQRFSYACARIVLAVVFVGSGAAKLMDPAGFAIIIDAYGILPAAMAFPAALAMSVLEVIAGIGLLMDLQWSLGIIAAMLIVFLLVLGYGLWLGLDVDCGCFGADDPEGRAYHGLRPAFYRDMAMLATVAYLYVQRMRWRLKPKRIACMGPTVFRKEYRR